MCIARSMICLPRPAVYTLSRHVLPASTFNGMTRPAPSDARSSQHFNCSQILTQNPLSGRSPNSLRRLSGILINLPRCCPLRDIQASDYHGYSPGMLFTDTGALRVDIACMAVKVSMVADRIESPCNQTGDATIQKQPFGKEQCGRFGLTVTYT